MRVFLVFRWGDGGDRNRVMHLASRRNKVYVCPCCTNAIRYARCSPSSYRQLRRVQDDRHILHHEEELRSGVLF